MTFARLITLLLALWAPYNAVTAGVSMLDCPMDDLASTQAEPCPSHATPQPGDDQASNTMGDCDHCASCVVHGGVSIPAALKTAIVALPQPAPDTRMADQVAPGIPSTPFRPPLSA